MSEQLFEAARSGDVSKVKSLLDSGVGVDIPDERGWTALFVACHNPEVDRGFPEVVSALIAAGADIERPIGYGMRPLMIAAGYGEAAVVEVLLKAGAQVRAKNEGGRTALQMATDKNYIDVINLLWEAEMLSGEVGSCGSKPSSAANVVNFVKR
ncbi:MAG TPA: ankyrin repeat domain-containing protein [Burkholderiales bacterium]|nr:ankyrin repeat domain-containing protein [Burkholderiales bacterium]